MRIKKGDEVIVVKHSHSRSFQYYRIGEVGKVTGSMSEDVLYVEFIDQNIGWNVFRDEVELLSIHDSPLYKALK